MYCRDQSLGVRKSVLLQTRAIHSCAWHASFETRAML
ncbi:hypothetical protein DFA_00664 [Cavenderia fasciculata]|uniref:Uncharacterized protein n=1 Tax=Cavenderia fasciculata TaxID=261658 RepID=F4PT63_CACFS|nr:uncharacterized protein DFA_00664 [Cavenderia fasciculata]EGG20799.1 hypothetical protein DFA_00664 [Cavenderia fasciculata]|eukprot:XP_004358649.1 hypothetical protein DFA_00664 [Cavenderia fasciculata]